MQDSFKTLIESAQDVLVLLPSKPNTDQVASGLSLYLSLTSIQKAVSISCPVDMTTEFSRLVGVDRISKDLGNKNLVIKFINYEAEDIDKVKADVENNVFTLTAIPKVGKKSPTKEQLEVSYSGGTSELVILIGGGNDSHFPTLANAEFKNSKLIHIGTKLLEVQTNDIEVLSFAAPASSVSELTASLIKESGFSVDSDIATNLLAWIEDRSNNFQSQDVTATTFEIFAELLKLGGKRMQKLSLPVNFPKGSIPTRPFSMPQTAKTFINQKQEENKVVTNNILQKTEEVVGTMTPEEAEKELEFDIPPSWSEPKIFTGTSVS